MNRPARELVDPITKLAHPPILYRIGLAVALLLASVAALGCTPVTYVIQAGCGQVDISLGARPIEDVLADRGTPPRIAALLAQVASIKRFGERHGLTATKNYNEYVNLGRSAAVWVVTASEPLRFQMKTWSFPIAGRVPYLGFFSRAAAVSFAEDLAGDGWDVDVRGASAYSTLGWFDDPVLSTMIPEGPEALGELANTVLHESAHATIYFADQSPMNEGIASFVGDALALLYLDERLGPSSPEREAYVQGEREGEARREVMHRVYLRLERLYASAASDEEKLAEKRRVLDALRVEISGRRPITNATLGQFKTYHPTDGAFDALLRSCGGSYPRFLSALKRLKPSSFLSSGERDIERVLEPLLRAGCGGVP